VSDSMTTIATLIVNKYQEVSRALHPNECSYSH